MNVKKWFIPFVASALLLGCESYTIVQRNVFSDANGNVLTVSYGRSESDHTSSFIAPATGEKVEFKTRHVIEVESYGEEVTAWQCQNLLSAGTMYMTNDEEWKILLFGFSVIVYHRTEESPPRYLEVYRGVLCETPRMETEKDDRWKNVTPARGREYRKASPSKK